MIQGDGISHSTIKSILEAVEAEGYSAQNVAFGMGGGLLQKVNRDTMNFATKLNKIVYANGESRDVMKSPKTDSSKFSLPGELAVGLDQNGLPVVYPKNEFPCSLENQLKVIYDHGPLLDMKWPLFDELKERISHQWTRFPKSHDPISNELKAKITSHLSKGHS